MGSPENTRDISSKKQPAFYIPHGGGPCFFMDWSQIGPKDTWEKMATWLKGIRSTLPESPRALILVSAHWEESEFTLLDHENPSLLFDYSGFPKHTYELTYPARVDRKLVFLIAEKMKSLGIESRRDHSRGFDHGVFIPLKLIFPDAEIPIIQISLKKDLSPEVHLRLGRALETFREQGVLVMGSGMSYHNLRELFSGREIDVSQAFDDWLTSAIEEKDVSIREKKLLDWERAPFARQAHPREEHFIPLFTVLGAAGRDEGRRVFTDRVMGAVTSAYRFG